MSRTVTALYDTRAEAEAARQRLTAAVDVERIKIIDKDSGGSDGSGSGSLGNIYMSNEDRHAYGEGLRRGGFLLCAEVDGDENPDEIVRLLEESSSVDFDRRQESWRSEGWAPYAATGGQSQSQTTGSSQQQAFGGQSQFTGTTGTTGNVVEEQRIPVVEEELRIGKREVERGGARVRSYVRETPVQEQVTLREEHVQVERRPVTETVSNADAADLLQERTIEMREIAEEAVVQKVAQVREEVVVSKTSEERTEQIEDTVRKTEVDIQEGAGSKDRSAFSGFGGDASAGAGTSSSSSTASSDFERNGNRS